MDPVQKRPEARLGRGVEGAVGPGLDRKAHHDVGGGELIARKPFRPLQFGLPEGDMGAQLRFDEAGQGPCSPRP